jgi:hypothetical protein
MNLSGHILPPDIARAQDMLRLLGKCHREWVGADTAGDRAAADRSADVAFSVLESATLPQLRAAVLIASEPATDRPVPVVLGLQDVSAAIGLDEMLGMLGAYAHACMAVGAGKPAAKREAEQAYKPLRKALEALFENALVYELARARDGRTP